MIDATDVVDLVEEDLLHRFGRRLGPVTVEPEARREAEVLAREIIARWRALLAGAPTPEETADGTPAVLSGVRLADLARAMPPLFEAVAETVTEPRALVLLQRCISDKLETLARTYDAYLIERAHLAEQAYRQRLAREIHDQLGNTLSVATRRLDLYTLSVERDPDAAEDRLTALRGSFDDLFDMLRWVVSDLKSCGSSSRLATGLWEYVQSMDPVKAEVSIAVNGPDDRLPEDLRCELITVLREAMRNALTHARARNLAVRAHVASHGVRAAVVDDGRGFDVEAMTESAPGHGLRSMRERVELLGGTCEVSSSRSGTRVEVWLPWTEPVSGPWPDHRLRGLPRP